MTVTSGSDTYKLYSGDGTTHVFAYTFRVFQNTELLVLIRNNTTGATYIASDAARSGSYDPDTHVGGEGLNTAYILSGVDDPNGGNVTFKYDTNNPSDENYSTTDYRPQTGESVIIIRVPAVSQETNYVPGGAFPAESHEDALDKLTFHVQRIEDQLNKTIQRPEADTGAVGSSIDSSLSVLPDNEDMKGKYLSFNATTGAPEAGATATDVVLSSSAQTLTNKSINADNNSISNLEVDNFKDSAVVTESEGIATFDNDTTLPTSAAVKDYVDSQVSAVPVSDILSITAGTGLTGGGSAGDVELSIDSTVVTLSGTGTLTNKTIDASQLTGTIDDARIPAATTTSPGLLSAADKTKLNGIDANATDDQTAAEIRTLVDSASDSNVFTDADKVRLEGIEAGADVTDTANVVAALTAGTNVTIAGDGTISATDTDTQYSEATTSTSGLMSAADKTKLDGVETGATADQTAAEILTEIKTVDGAASGLDADLLDGQEGSYYTGYTDSAVANLVDSAPATLDTLNELAAALGDDANFSTTVTNSIATKLPLAGGTMTGNIVMSGTETVDGRDLSVDGAKLDGIEALADVTDATNVNAAGAAIFSTTPTANITDGTSGQVLTTNGSGGLSFTTVSGGGGISNVVEDTTPQLGGDLDTNGNDINFADNAKVTFGNDGDLEILHNSFASQIRDVGNGGLVLQTTNGAFIQLSTDFDIMAKFYRNGAAELYYDNSKKLETVTGGVDITGDITVSGTVDGRDLSADGTKLDGIEASADVTDTANVTAAGALMDSEVTNLAQVKAFDSSDYATAAQGTTADAALPKSGGTMTGNITFSGSQTFDGRDLSVDGAKLDGIESGATADQTAAEIRTLVESASDSNVFTDADHTKLNGIEASADVTDTANVTAAGALMDSEVTNLADVKSFDPADYATAAQGTTADAAMPKAGGTFTGDVTFTGDSYNVVWDKSDNALEFADNAKVTFGADGDLEIFHSGTASVIRDGGTGPLRVRANATHIQDPAATETMASFTQNGAVELFYDNVKKLETTSDGVTITSTDDGAANAPILTLYRDSASPADFDNLGNILFVGKNDAGQDVTFAELESINSDVSDGTEDGLVRVKIMISGTLTNQFDFANYANVSYKNLLLTAGRQLVFEGSTDDGNETFLTVTDPTADRTIALPDADGTVALQNQTINAQTGTTYTTVLSDAAQLVTLNNASAITLTIPPNSSVAYPTGTRIDFIQIGAGQVTVAGGTGVTVNSTPTLKFRAQHSAASCIKIATDTWQLVGDLAES